MATLRWDAPKQRKLENGVSKGVLYPKGRAGVVWNGLTAITEKPTGGEEVALHADNHKYASFRTAEGFEGTIEAYTYPEAFSECDGSVSVTDGVKIGQQKRLPFDFCYRTEVISAGDSIYDKNYKLHLIFNAIASPSDRNYQTLNDSPDATQLSWNIQCLPFAINGHKAASTITIDTSKADRIKVEAIESILYGLNGEEPRMPNPDEIVNMLKRLDLHRVFIDVFGTSGNWIWDTFNFREDTVPIAIDRESMRHVYSEPEPGTEYLLPAIAYSLLSESENGQRSYMLVVADTARPSTYVTELKSRLSLSGEEVIKSGDTYYYTYTLQV